MSTTMDEKYQQKLVRWTRDGYPEHPGACGDTDKWEDEIWWGYWRQVGGEMTYPPDALFPTEKEALAFAAIVGERYDWHVQPVVLQIEARDNFEVPSAD